MSSTEKKLDALIEALGFDVEERHVFSNFSYQCAKAEPGSAIPVNKEDYIHAEFNFTKRDSVLKEKEMESLVSVYLGSALDMQNKEVKPEPREALKMKILRILKKAGKEPKLNTLCVINHEIDKAFGDSSMQEQRTPSFKCSKCGTHLSNNAPLNSCLCKTPLNIVRID